MFSLKTLKVLWNNNIWIYFLPFRIVPRHPKWPPYHDFFHFQYSPSSEPLSIIDYCVEITKESVVIFLTVYNVSIRFFFKNMGQVSNSDKSKIKLSKNFLQAAAGLRLESRLLFWKKILVKKHKLPTTPLEKWSF